MSLLYSYQSVQYLLVIITLKGKSLGTSTLEYYAGLLAVCLDSLCCTNLQVYHEISLLIPLTEIDRLISGTHYARTYIHTPLTITCLKEPRAH